jgi:plastocyanin
MGPDAGPAPEAGAVRMHFAFGPLTVQPGQNVINYSGRSVPKPSVDGYIVRFAANLRRADGSIPPVDVIHLHHGVWLTTSEHDTTMPAFPERFFAAGEEKTILTLPPGYGYQYKASDTWIINYMLHNLFPEPQQIWITYDIDLIPATAPQAATTQPAHPVWMDVQNGSGYPVFDVIQGSGKNGTYTYPEQATDPYGNGPAKNQWTVPADGVLLTTAGHLHPGGLHTDLYDTRAGKTAHLFQSDADYFEPAGAVSWDVAMTATNPGWDVQVHKGDVLKIDATYDTTQASWYESMGIMVVWMANGTGGRDPFTTKVDQAGQITHGHLAENNNHGGGPTNLPDATALPGAPQQGPVDIKDFAYQAGDTSEPGTASIPTVKAGQSITFDNLDAPLDAGIWHTITACKAPCNAATGIAFPLANAAIPFDSGELGDVGPPTSGHVTWQTPASLPPGTYTYFCRIHPFMRGAFRVTG